MQVKHNMKTQDFFTPEERESFFREVKAKYLNQELKPEKSLFPGFSLGDRTRGLVKVCKYITKISDDRLRLKLFRIVDLIFDIYGDIFTLKPSSLKECVYMMGQRYGHVPGLFDDLVAPYFGLHVKHCYDSITTNNQNELPDLKKFQELIYLPDKWIIVYKIRELFKSDYFFNFEYRVQKQNETLKSVSREDIHETLWDCVTLTLHTISRGLERYCEFAIFTAYDYQNKKLHNGEISLYGPAQTTIH